MYKKNFLLCVAAILFCNISFAKIWRVNNTAGITADFTTAQAAHDGAAAGDTIHLEPSLISYGSLSTSKRLTWISTGNFLSSHPGLQYSSTPGAIDFLSVSTGSENSVFSCNTGGIQCQAANITFNRCFISSNFLALSYADNCVIIDCYINAYVDIRSSTNAIINNNIIASYFFVETDATASIANNVMNVTIGSSGGAINNSQFQNNIIDQAASPYAFTNCTVNNNISNDASLPAGNGNQNNVNMSTVFVNYQGTTDGDFVLKTGGGNPAIGTGFGGIDMGAFGGTSAFVIGLQPAVPAIYQLNAPASPSGNTMNVTFSTKSNN